MLVASHGAMRATITWAGSRSVCENSNERTFAVRRQEARRSSQHSKRSPVAVVRGARCDDARDPGTADFLQTRAKKQNV
jgi:hypothetical protein